MSFDDESILQELKRRHVRTGGPTRSDKAKSKTLVALVVGTLVVLMIMMLLFGLLF